MFRYDPLWETMEKRTITTYTLINKYEINPRTINHLKHNKSVSMNTLDKLCTILNCKIEDIVEIVLENN